MTATSRCCSRPGSTGLDALVSHTASGRGFVPEFAMKSRGWSPEQWDAAALGLQERGILDADGTLTDEGAVVRKQLEDDTDRLGVGPWAHLGPEGAARLGELGGAVVRSLLAAGCFPKDARRVRPPGDRRRVRERRSAPPLLPSWNPASVRWVKGR